jgi:hypothetical protein
MELLSSTHTHEMAQISAQGFILPQSLKIPRIIEGRSNTSVTENKRMEI